LVKYWDKYTEMHGQQNAKKKKKRNMNIHGPVKLHLNVSIAEAVWLLELEKPAVPVRIIRM